MKLAHTTKSASLSSANCGPEPSSAGAHSSRAQLLVRLCPTSTALSPAWRGRVSVRNAAAEGGRSAGASDPGALPYLVQHAIRRVGQHARRQHRAALKLQPWQDELFHAGRQTHARAADGGARCGAQSIREAFGLAQSLSPQLARHGRRTAACGRWVRSSCRHERVWARRRQRGASVRAAVLPAWPPGGELPTAQHNRARPHAGPVSSTPRAPVPAAVHELLDVRLRCCRHRERHGCCCSSTLRDACRACRAVARPDYKRARSADLRQHVVCACPRGGRPAAAPRAMPRISRRHRISGCSPSERELPPRASPC